VVSMESQNHPLIEAENLGKVYFRKDSAPVKALEGFDFEVFQGEFLAIIGRSGSGKTTLLNLLGALDLPTSGEIRFEGRVLSGLSNRDLAIFRREKVGFIFQTFNLLPSFTVFENVESALFHSGMSKDRLRGKVAASLDVLGLTEMSDRFPLELSVGQQQKVAIARAIVKDPVLVLADEPTGEMDPVTGREILEQLIDLNRKLKVTLIVASHRPLMHSDVDRVLFIKDGRITSQKEAGY
jgi:putative ABC transport system ATP-binding protein